jgi:uncharacterized protein YfbU (UPF0304 family)
MRYNDAVLADMDTKIKTLAGEHYDALKAEFVNFNDMRVATVRELLDLGLPRNTANNVLHYLREVETLMYPNLKQKGDDVESEQPMDAEEVA